MFVLVPQFLQDIQRALDVQLFVIGENTFTLWSVVYILFLALVLFYASRWLGKLLVDRVLEKRGMELGVRVALGTIFRYIVIFFGLLIILQTAGIDLSSVTVLAGALGIGVGFGLQNIASDFVSGLIIMVSRPVKVGDRVEVGGVVGDVIAISARSTSITTNDNISIIVPNSEFIRNNVINWSHADRNVRLHLPVGVSYNADPDEVRKILLEVAAGHASVLTSPPPDVIFLGFGESSIDFDLRFWTSDFITKPNVIKSDLYYATWYALKRANIEIPFPQRDVHIKSGNISTS